MAGAKGGAILGAKIGSIIPGKGTVIGAAIGGFIGLVGGSVLGSSLAGGTADTLTGANKSQQAGSDQQEKDDFSDMPGLKNVFHKGGIVPGSGERMAKLLGGEMVIDLDSVEPAKEMLLAINEASGAQGVIDAIAQYAPYELKGEKVIVVEGSSPPPPQPRLGDSVSSMMAPLQVSGVGGSNYDPFEILHKGV